MERLREGTGKTERYTEWGHNTQRIGHSTKNKEAFPDQKTKEMRIGVGWVEMKWDSQRIHS